jgi:hypothetical protein
VIGVEELRTFEKCLRMRSNLSDRDKLWLDNLRVEVSEFFVLP